MGMSLSKLQEIVKDKEAWRAEVHEITWVRHDLVTEQQQQKKKTKTLTLKQKRKRRKEQKKYILRSVFLYLGY